MKALIKITGTQIGYYFVCHRKLWLFSRGLQCEQESDNVRLGKFIHETSYSREKKELDIDSTIVLDWFDEKEGIVHEVKKSDSMEEAHEWQTLYYLWFLKQKGLHVADENSSMLPSVTERGIIGELNYPKLRKKETVILTQAKQKELEEKILPHVEKILSSEEIPSAAAWKVCKSCSYCELCHS